MIEHVNDLKLQFLVELSKLGDRCAAIESDLAGWLTESRLHVRASRRSRSCSCRTSSRPGRCGSCSAPSTTIMPVLDRFCAAYPDDAALREELALPAAEDELARLDPGFPQPVRICRLDAFLHNYDVKFLEFNSDSPAGIGWCDVLFEGLRRGVALPRVTGVFHTLYTPMLPALIDTLLDAYGQRCARAVPTFPSGRGSRWSTSPGRRPRRSSASSPAPRASAGSTPSSRAWTSCATTARGLYAGASRSSSSTAARSRPRWRAATWPPPAGRRARASSIRSARAWPAARRSSPCCRIRASSTCCAAHEAETDPRDAAVDAHPAARPRDVRAVAFDLLSVRVRQPRAARAQAGVDYGGRGVMLGNETDQDDLGRDHRGARAARRLHRRRSTSRSPRRCSRSVEDGRVQMRLKRFNINPFAIGGRYAGMLTRISDQAVINVAAGRRHPADGDRPPPAAAAARGGRPTSRRQLPELTGVSL